MKASGHLFVSHLLVLLCVAAVTPATHAGDKKPKSDWDAYFGAGITPAYPFSGTLRITRLGDYRASYTDGAGNTTSFYCFSTADSTDCSDGPGLSFELVQPDGSSISVSRMPSTEQDPLKWMLSGGDALFENSIGDAKTGRVFHFRWKDAPYGLPMKLLCVPITGTESIPDGKARKEYAKNHRMESCYFATAMFGPSLAVHAIANNSEVGSQQEQDARIQKGEASIVIVGTRPTGAKIWIDGNEAGITPMAFVLLRHRDTPRSILVTLDGYKTVEKRVVPDGKTIPIGVTLEPN